MKLLNRIEAVMIGNPARRIERGIAIQRGFEKVSNGFDTVGDKISDTAKNITKKKADKKEEVKEESAAEANTNESSSSEQQEEESDKESEEKEEPKKEEPEKEPDQSSSKGEEDEKDVYEEILDILDKDEQIQKDLEKVLDKVQKQVGSRKKKSSGDKPNIIEPDKKK